MFDFSLMGKPCLLYPTDVHQYNRGYYFNIHELPYPLAESGDELLEVIETFDRLQYENRTHNFFANHVGSMEYGHASEQIAEWMHDHSIK
jgi:CDP-glycerol glycerophosphotransferase